MQRGYSLTAVILVAAPLLLGFGSNDPMHPNDPNHSRMHPLNTECTMCHVIGTDLMRGNASALTNTQEQLCNRCHANSMQKSHPSGLIPKNRKAISARYPLDWRGYLTCSTCHEVHGDFPGRLRDNVRGRDMCLSCHSQEFFDSMRNEAAHRLSP